VNESQQEPEHCRNCGTALTGVYCHECGQSSAIIRRPTKEVLDDAIGNVFHWDSRLVHTLRLLFFRPGKLALEWIEGRRMRYVPPFRLYIIASFILFLLVGISARQGSENLEFVTISDDAITEIQESVDKAKANGEWLSGIFLQATLEAIKDPSGYVRKIVSNLPKAAFVFLPIFALLHMAVDFRKRRFYIDYLVFSLHFHAFIFSLIALTLVMGLISEPLGSFAELFYFAIPVYGLVAFRNFNQQGWGKSFLKGSLVSGGYTILLGIGIAFFFAAILFL
jgi:hypothetical protein